MTVEIDGSRFDAITFDCYGTLIDWEAGLSQYLQPLLGAHDCHVVESFLFEWCLYHAADQAVKCSYAGTAWDDAQFARRMAQAREQLALLALPVKTLTPGQYRVYFTPALTSFVIMSIEPV